jgi:Protein of unknown function (DUF2933)
VVSVRPQKGGVMTHREWSLYPAILAVVIIGLLAFGVPASALAYAVFTLACPLIVIFMHGGAAASTDWIAANLAGRRRR